jgi:PPK2 family polyphosphate:nucleotide phosphotransferase
MKIEPKDFCVDAGAGVELDKWPTRVAAFYKDGAEYTDAIGRSVDRIDTLQRLLYASGKYSLLLIFQAMDAAGKDGAIRHVLSGINPQGCQVYSFKQPSSEELAHDFLWRTHCRLPERGRIGVFNRSYYEDVLVVRVHPEILAKSGLPEKYVRDKHIWRERFDSIRSFEDHLSRNGTVIVKFFLHVSRDEQRKRLLERIDDPEKNWKFSEADVVERKFWKSYMKAYEECLAATSTAAAPWYVVPADDKKNAHLIIARIIQKTLKGLDMAYPAQGKERVEELLKIRRALEND